MTIAQALLAPVFLHVLLTAVIGVRLGRARVASVRARETRLEDIALNNKAWPGHVLKFSNNFDNQFQVPMLWYACCGLMLATGLANWAAVALSWVFLASRVVHSAVHTGSNNVKLRFRAFIVGFFVAGAMWALFAVRLYVTG